MELNLSLTIEEGQKILDVLAQEPYIDVFELIDKIQVQSSEQVRDYDKTKDK